jgi:hypothetical protein
MLGLLQEHGFIKPNVKGRFHVKTRFATTWILTRYECNGSAPTMDFAKFKQRGHPVHQTGAPSAPDGPEKSLSGAPSAPDSADFDPSTGAPSAPQLVYQGAAPKGTRQAKAAWLRGHLSSGALTPAAVADVLAIRPNEVASIAVGKTELGQFGWRKIAALVESRLH